MQRRAQSLLSAIALAAARLRADPAARERTLAAVVFAAIFAFGVGSVDYLITGGPDWNPGGMGQAYAMEIAHPRYVAAQAAPPQAADVPAVVETAAIEDVDYSIATEELLGGPDAFEFAAATLVQTNGKSIGAGAVMLTPAVVENDLKSLSVFETALPW